jgi:hypothetical protein
MRRDWSCKREPFTDGHRARLHTLIIGEDITGLPAFD